MMTIPSILVVDDEPDNFDVIEAFLSDRDYQLHYAWNGLEALKSLHVFQPDVILLDVMMPELDGITTCQKIKAMPEWKSVPIIMVTALSDKEDLARCIQAGADDFISKPVNSTELRARVQSMLRIRQQYQSIQELSQLQERTIDILQGSLDELRGSLSMSLPHELNTPLNGIFGVLGILIEEHEDMDHEEIAELLQLAKTSTMRLERVSRRYLNYIQLVRDSSLKLVSNSSMAANVASTASEIALETIDSAEWIANASASQTNSVKRSADLVLDLATAQLSMSIKHLQTIVEELLDNAIKFSQAGTPITIKTESMDSWLYLSITNQGRGMTELQIAQIGAFIQFERRSYEQQGLGLGLAIVQKLIDRYGGSLLIQSVVDQETTVTAKLPLAVQPQMAMV
ncbi:response regulator [Limnothrix sp. FACHB-1083]|uniref:hybrid sensor histidine kinase/response regulator n=2 Tax=unclassified Limnothrix TaxID=2632864 RepID=UPI0018F0128C|nr:response regulator [Limnothrix sp. FACHB-1083]